LSPEPVPKSADPHIRILPVASGGTSDYDFIINA